MASSCSAYYAIVNNGLINALLVTFITTAELRHLLLEISAIRADNIQQIELKPQDILYEHYEKNHH